MTSLATAGGVLKRKGRPVPPVPSATPRSLAQTLLPTTPPLSRGKGTQR